MPLNATLKEAAYFGMQFHYVSRSAYRDKKHPNFIKNLERQFGNFYLIPEGGSNALAIKGCSEILNETSGLLISNVVGFFFCLLY